IAMGADRIDHVQDIVPTMTLSPHPRLIVSAEQLAAIRQRLAADALLARVYESEKKAGDATLAAPALRYEKQGMRLLGVSRAALAAWEDDPPLAAKTVRRAVELVPQHAMKVYDPDGVYPEGPGYWEYGTSYNVLMIEALRSALGSDFGIASAPGFRQTA